MTTLHYHGHSFWEIRAGSQCILIDPFITGNRLTDVRPEQFTQVSAILISHGHGDHIGDSVAIAKRSGSLVVASYEIAQYCAQRGCQAHGMNIGGACQFPFGRVKLTIAHHSSTGPEGEALGDPAGIVFTTTNGQKVYHAGDTALFLDMQLIAEMNGPFDVALLPIGDNFTMGIADAVKATEFLHARMHCPMHYNTFPPIEVNPQDFVDHVTAAGRAAKLITPGSHYAIP